MTLAGMTLAIGPMIDSAIICLENTHRHLGLGATPHEAAFLGASEVAMPELVSTLCTFLVLSPLVFTPGPGAVPVQADGDGRGVFDDRRLHPVADPGARVQRLLAQAARRHTATGGGHGAGHGHGRRPRSSPACRARDLHRSTATVTARPGRRPGMISRAFARWEQMIDDGIEYYVKGLDFVLRHPLLTVVRRLRPAGGDHSSCMWPIMRREFFPEVDAGAFEMYVRAPSGLRIEETEKRIKAVEDFVHKTIERGRPPARSLRDRRHLGLVGRLHPERRPDGRRGQDPA